MKAVWGLITARPLGAGVDWSGQTWVPPAVVTLRIVVRGISLPLLAIAP